MAALNITLTTEEIKALEAAVPCEQVQGDTSFRDSWMSKVVLPSIHGLVETDEEILLIIKTTRALLDSLTAHVKCNHPYTIPEVIALPILGGSDSHVKWVVDNTQKVGDMLPAV